MESRAKLKADLIASFETTGYTSELATKIANAFDEKLYRKETEDDGNNQRTNSGSAE